MPPPPFLSVLFILLITEEIAKSMDVEGKGLQETQANANFLGTYALHAVCDSGNMYALQYLVEDLNMDVNKPDTMRGDPPYNAHVSIYVLQIFLFEVTTVMTLDLILFDLNCMGCILFFLGFTPRCMPCYMGTFLP
jgi:hypothetical protein